MKIWQDKEVVQNALQLSAAIYKPNPHQYIRNRQNTMTISEIIAIGDLNIEEEKQILKQSCIFALETYKINTLYIAMKGTETSNDWKTNLDFEMVENEFFLGKFHKGFFNRSLLADLDDIENMIIKYSVQRVVTCGHSMGGAVSSILHLRLAKYFDIKKISIKLVNLTFGAPLFGNDLLCQLVARKWTYNQMFHFVAAKDAVPAVLSLGNTIQYLNDAVANTLPIPTAVTKFVQSNLGSIKTLVSLTVGLTKVLAQNGSQETQKTIKQFAASMTQLMNSPEASTLFNEYNQHQYVPIGQFLLLHQRQNKYRIEPQPGDPKVIENLLTSIEEEIARSPSKVLDIKSEHGIDKYVDHVKEAFDGFVTKMHQPIIFAKINFDWIQKAQFSFKAPWQLVCGFNGCAECSQTLPLYDQDLSLLKQGVECCLTCHHDTTNPHLMEIYFHKKCWVSFHQGEKSKHVKISIPSDLLEAKGQVLKELFDKAKDFNGIKIIALYDPQRRQRLIEKYHPDKSYESWATNGAKLLIQLMNMDCIASTVPVPYFAKKVIPHLGKTKIIGLGASMAMSGVMFLGSTGYFFSLWMQNKITSIDFARKTLIEIFSMGVAIGMEAAISATGIGVATAAGVTLATSPVGWVVSGLSVILSIVGYAATKKMLEHFLKIFGLLQNPTKEEEAKADQIAEAIVLLDLYEPDIKRLEVVQIERQYRKILMQNLHWHQDHFPEDATAEDKLVAKLCFETLNMSKDILITVIEQPELLSDKIRGLIMDKVSTMERMTIKEFVSKKRRLYKPIVNNALPIEQYPSNN